jgi:hypothetical protein
MVLIVPSGATRRMRWPVYSQNQIAPSGTAHDAEGIVDLSRRGWAAITTAAFHTGSSKGGDGPFSRRGGVGEESEEKKRAHGDWKARR